MLSEDESVCSHVTYRVCERRSTDIRSCGQTYAMHVVIPTPEFPLNSFHYENASLHSINVKNSTKDIRGTSCLSYLNIAFYACQNRINYFWRKLFFCFFSLLATFCVFLFAKCVCACGIVRTNKQSPPFVILCALQELIQVNLFYEVNL